MLNVELLQILNSLTALGSQQWFLFALASAVITAIIAVMEKRLLQHEHTLTFSAGHALLAFLLSLPLLFFADFSKVTPFILVMMYFGMFAAAGAFWLTARGVKHLEMSISSPLTVVNLAFIPFLAFFFLGERLSLQQGAGIFLIFIGVVALEFFQHNSKLFRFSDLLRDKYLVLTIIGGLLYAVTAIVDKVSLSTLDPFTYLVIAHFFIAINSLLIMAFLDHEFKKDLRQLFSQDAKTVFVVSLLSIVQRLSLAFAIQGAFVSLAVAVKKLSSLFATIMAGRLFHERHIVQKTLVSLIMIAGAALLVLS